MSEELTTPAPVCEHCGATVVTGKKFCTQCSFPVEGTEEEQYKFRLLVSSRKRFLSDAKDKIKGARIAILVLAGLVFITGLIALLVNDDVPTFVVNAILSVIYLVLASWTSRNPFAAILIAFILYVTLQIANAIVEPITLVSGIIWKVVIIGAFIKGIRSAHEAKGIIEELQKLKVTVRDE